MKEKWRLELEKLSADSEVRAFENLYDKATYILLNYSVDADLTKTNICTFFNLDHHNLQKRVWATLQGWTDHELHRTRYLSESQEHFLYDYIVQRLESGDSLKTMEFYEEVKHMFLTC